MTEPKNYSLSGFGRFGDRRVREVVERIDVADHPERLAEGGFWVLVGTFEGTVQAWRFAEVEQVDDALPEPAGHWDVPVNASWSTSEDAAQYQQGVARIREYIREGDVYQVNLCRVLQSPWPVDKARRGEAFTAPDAAALYSRLQQYNPAPHASYLVIPDDDVWIVSASPELYVQIDGTTVRSSPIKGTAAPGEQMLPKDVSENIMITDLVRNDLAHVARPGTVRVPELLAEHELPGLIHLQSTVEVELADEFDWTPAMWRELLNGTFPPGSVSGAPKSSALRIISELESAPRGPYCGAIGWIDADNRQASLAVGIRTFWWQDQDGGVLRFGTGAGITWDSDPQGEWEETELKARRLIAIASGATIST